MDHFSELCKNLPLDGIEIVAFLSQLPVHASPVQPTGIFCIFLDVFIIPVIHLSDLISTVEQRNSRICNGHRMKQQDPLYGKLHFIHMLLIQSLFQPAQGCKRSAVSGILCDRIIFIQFSYCKASWIPAFHELNHILLMQLWVKP